jgi:hypothetical protein
LPEHGFSENGPEAVIFLPASDSSLSLISYDRDKPMFNLFHSSTEQKSTDIAMSQPAFGTTNPLPTESWINSRIDLLTESLNAQLPKRGYFKH